MTKPLVVSLASSVALSVASGVVFEEPKAGVAVEFLQAHCFFLAVELAVERIDAG